MGKTSWFTTNTDAAFTLYSDPDHAWIADKTGAVVWETYDQEDITLNRHMSEITKRIMASPDVTVIQRKDDF